MVLASACSNQCLKRSFFPKANIWFVEYLISTLAFIYSSSMSSHAHKFRCSCVRCSGEAGFEPGPPARQTKSTAAEPVWEAVVRSHWCFRNGGNWGSVFYYVVSCPPCSISKATHAQMTAAIISTCACVSGHQKSQIKDKRAAPPKRKKR